MGESAACLVRSFSQPSPTSDEEKKVSSYSRSTASPVLIFTFCCSSIELFK